MCFGKEASDRVEGLGADVAGELQGGEAVAVRDESVSAGLHEVFHDKEVACAGRDVEWGVLQVLGLFVDVLAFADEDADEVKVAVPAGAPHVYSLVSGRRSYV